MGSLLNRIAKLRRSYAALVKLCRSGLSNFERHRQWLVLLAVEPYILNRPELLARADRANALWWFDKPEEVTITDNRDRELPTALQRSLGTYANSWSFVCELRNAALVGTEPIGVTAKHEIILETTDAHRVYLWFRLSSHLESHSLLNIAQESRELTRGRPQPSLTNYDLDIAFPLIKTDLDTYYHWVLEWLPKVRALERYRKATGRDPTVLISSEVPSWMRETLLLVGLNPDNCVPYDESITVDRLVIPSHRNRVLSAPWMAFPDDFNPSLTDCRWIRERINRNLPTNATLPEPAAVHDHSPRVYVSRRKAEHQRVLNEKSVIDTLKPLGFEPYILEDYSIVEQVMLFRESEVVVAPHGSGLVNLVYAESRPHVIELFKQGDIRAFYYILARQLGLPYDCIVGENIGKNMRIDPHMVRVAAEDAIERRTN